MNIPGHLKNLLLLNEQVILPGFGEFITSEVKPPDPPHGALGPPAKTLRFNAGAKANDYVLARYVADRENLSVAECNNAIREFVEELARQFDEFREIKIAGIGTFFLEEEGGALRFAPDPDINFHPDAFGLGVVSIDPPSVQSIQPIVEQPAASGSLSEEPETVLVPGPHPEPTPPPRRRKMLYLTLIIVISLCTAAITLHYLYPDRSQAIVDRVKSVLPFGKEEGQRPDSVVPEQPKPIEDDVPVPDQEPSDGSPAEPQSEKYDTPEVTTPVVTPASGRFAINAGAFSSRTNAEQLVVRLRSEGFQDATLDGQTGTGLWRVTAGSFRSEEEALTALRKAQSENKLPNGWVSERKN